MCLPCRQATTLTRLIFLAFCCVTSVLPSRPHSRHLHVRRASAGSPGSACEDPGDEFTCPISRFCIDGDQCYTDTPDWLRVEEIIKHWGLGKIKHLADDPTCNKFGSGANTILLEDSISLDEEGNRIIIPCEFTRHDITLKPSDAGSKANWPFIEESYLAEYTQVTWSTEGAGVSPPPPPQFTFLG